MSREKRCTTFFVFCRSNNRFSLFQTETELNPFRGKDTLQRLRDNPTTSEYMKDPSFVAGITEISNSHQALQKSAPY